MSGAGYGDPPGQFPTGYDCGTWQTTTMGAFDFDGDNIAESTLTGMGRTTGIECRPGDSGAPVWSDESFPNPGVFTIGAVGIQSARSIINGTTRCWFSTVANVSASLGVSVLTDSRYVPFQAAHSGKCAHAPNDSNGTKLEQRTCNGSANQLFRVLPRYGWYQVGRSPYRCIDVEGGMTTASRQDGVRLQQWDCLLPPENHLNQVFWFAWSSSYGQDFQVVNQWSQRCMDVRMDLNPPGGYGDGAWLQQWACASGGGSTGNQRWRHY